jgi:hypothetical protein
MTEAEKVQMLTEARQFYIAAPILLPLLEKRKADALNRLIAKHRDGDNKYDTLVSEISVLTNLQHDINSKEAIYRTLEGNKK